MRASIHPIRANRGTGTGSEGRVCFAADLSTRNVNSVEFGYAVDLTKIIILPASEISIILNHQTYSIMSLLEQSMDPMRKTRPMKRTKPQIKFRPFRMRYKLFTHIGM